ncbi:hypothetical protein J6590_104884, partial [Homalodisca vitripennis]
FPYSSVLNPCRPHKLQRARWETWVTWSENVRSRLSITLRKHGSIHKHSTTQYSLYSVNWIDKGTYSTKEPANLLKAAQPKTQEELVQRRRSCLSLRILLRDYV